MAQYLILIYEDEAAWAAGGPQLAEQMLKEHRAFGERNGTVLRGGQALHPAATATSIRTDAAGAVSVTDGAFAETKEALGGFYLIEAADLDQAIAVARQVPAPFGGVEVRPVRELG
ncbi:YciI family protein [Kitasatospora sp. NPDC094015]|uniref:YciI family protein n=1 Tax=Kitasatospora sp. NPDC094015 TaxID=3155205 RepID=UPI0033273C73